MIINNGKQEDMDCLGEMLIKLINESPEERKYRNKIIGMAYNYTIPDEMAYEIVSEMKPKGEVWSKDVINGVVGGVPNLNDYYVVMNSLINDYGEVIPQEEVDTYVKMTNAWLNDIDGHHNKVWWYFVKKD